MTISQAMHTGVTGLSVMSDGMSVVANNIANANAKGFKYDRAEFEDLISQDLNSSGNSQLGRGARLARVRTAHTQGGLAVTDRLTDLAVEGEGFFIVKNPNILNGGGGEFYTRVGAFNFDKDGYLIDNNGGRIQGYQGKNDGTLSTLMSDYRLDTNSLPPQATQKVDFNLNLDSRTPVSEVEFNMQDPEGTSDFSNSANIFDSHGNAHNMTTFFKRIPSDEDGIKWQYFSCVSSSEVTDPEDGSDYKMVASGSVTFNSKGQLLAEQQEDLSANFNKGAAPGQKITLDFGVNVGEEKGDGVTASRSTATNSETVFHTQDGYESGNLKSLKIKPNGEIRGYYTNGIEKLLGGLGLATFSNVDGLRKAGRNQFYKTLESGEARVGQPQSGTRGAIFASTLEESNVDMAGQFVNMIMTQRGFQANSRSITTADSMIEEVVNMKR